MWKGALLKYGRLEAKQKEKLVAGWRKTSTYRKDFRLSKKNTDRGTELSPLSPLP